MNNIDIVLGIIFIIAFFMGFRKGLLRSLASLIGLVAAVYGAMFFSDYIEVYLIKWFDWSDDLNRIAAFLIMFLLIMLVFALLGRALTKVANFMMLGIFNKLFGGVFNTLKFAFLLSVIFMFVNASEEYQILSQRDRDSSLLYHPVAVLAPAILPEIQKHVQELDIDFINDDKTKVYPSPKKYQESDSTSSTFP
jgi:membrane protein required for colicin V production